MNLRNISIVSRVISFHDRKGGRGTMEKTKFLILLTASAVFGALIALLITGNAFVPQSALPSSAEMLQDRFADSISGAMPAVVLITAGKKVGIVRGEPDPFGISRGRIDLMEIPSGLGSGFFIREDGHILTNWHVIRDQDSFRITVHDGSEYNARVIGADPSTDLAVLKIDSSNRFPILKFAKPEHVKIGHWAIAIGAPFSLSRTVTAGIVSSLGRKGVGMNLYENYVQTDASVNPGNSGGPLLNIHGEVIGVNDFILSPSGGNIGLSFAISSAIAKDVSDELIRNGRVERPWLGVALAELSRNDRARLGGKYGVLILHVFPRSPAAGNLHRGDVIMEIDGKGVSLPADVQNAVFGAEKGKPLTLLIRRDGTLLKMEIDLTAVQ